MIEKKSLYQWEHSPSPEEYIKDPFISPPRLPGGDTGMIEKKSLYQWEHSPSPDWYIEDPFDVKHNLSGRTSENGRKRIILAMEKALGKLNDFDTAFLVNRKQR